MKYYENAMKSTLLRKQENPQKEKKKGSSLQEVALNERMILSKPSKGSASWGGAGATMGILLADKGSTPIFDLEAL